MFHEESLEVRQSNEFEALQAIYGEELKDLRKKAAWNTWSPLNLSITLTPQRGSSGNGEVYVKVDLHVICSENYPNKVPELLIENSKGISQSHLHQLKNDLKQKAEEYKGEVMIFQLCQYVEEFLHRHNKKGMKSFYDEMLQKQQEKKLKEEMQKQMEDDKQKETLMKEIQKRQELLYAEVRLRKERQKSVSEIETEEEIGYRKSSSTNRRRHNSSTENADDFPCGHKGSVLLNFSGRSVQRGQCLRHIDPGIVIFSGIDTDSGELVEITQWNIQVKNNESHQILKNVTSIEQELNYLTKFKHTNLAHYFGLKHDLERDKMVVYVLKEFICGSSCDSLFTDQSLKVDIDYLKHVASGVLAAIDYIHRNNVVHKNLRGSCITLSDKGVVKVSDYSIFRRLLDLVNSTHGYYSKKTDIFDFGRVILHLMGLSSDSEDNVQIPTHIQSDLYDLLSKCLNDEKDRYTANQLLGHPFFHKPIVYISPQHLPQNVPMERNISPEITHTVPLGHGQSRIDKDFEILEHLGKGAFGAVLKAKNNLDGGYYAIKRIKLNPKNKALNKKIVREVTLLSKLNHENVVRYYNAWIETTTIKENDDPDEEPTSVSSTTTTEPNRKVLKVVDRKAEFSLNDDIEKMAPPMKNVETSVTYDSKSQAPYDESSDDDSSDEDDPFMAPVGNRFDQDSDSDSIEFERGSDEEESSSSKPKSISMEAASKPVVENPVEVVKQVHYLYIQMEFCEKSTLRTAIDGDLYLDGDRVWRLFREIVEGLVHIHQQGMIHRDLKPVNIFLDSFDHVKIGDFGLATTIAIRSKQGEFFGISKSHAESAREDFTDESKTGQVGTALYVAPEINSATKAFYNQKVDIYSLGIILFEMCYPPLETGMERHKILTKLRTKDVSFPDDFDKKNQRAQFLIRWLLNHDISKRPTSQELLQSEHLPPPVLEERELQEFIRNTLSNPQLKGYRYLISSCFKQTITPAQDFTYDRDPTNPMSSKPFNLYEFVREACVKIFKLHGGQNLTTPLLMPKSTYNNVEYCVNLMTHFGNIVTLPHDHRVPFARYVAWNNIHSFRRYSVDRVFNEKKVFGFLPREFQVCAFDIVTPHQGNLMSDAELLYIVYEIINELPGVKNKHFVIRLNHTALFKAILIYCGLKDKHEELAHLLSDIKEGKVPKYQLQNFLKHRNLPDSTLNLLINLLQSEIEFGKAVNQFQMITKKKTAASNLAKQALQELRTIVQNAELYGVEFDFVIEPGLVYNIHQYSGMMCQFVCDLKKKRKRDNKEVVATGGRYDPMISHYRKIMEQANMLKKDIQQSAVGISIWLDKLVQVVQKHDSKELPKIDNLDAIVCSIGSKQLIKEKTKILKSLWAAGVRCFLIEASNNEELKDQLLELGVSIAIILKDDDQGLVRVRSWDKGSKESYDKFQEKLYTTSDLVENIQKMLRRNDSVADNAQASNVLARSESKTSYSEKADSESVVDILFVTSDRMPANARRRYENQVRSQLVCLFKKLSGLVTVMAVNIESMVVRSLTSFLDFESESEFQKSVQNCIGKHQKHNQYLHEICDEIWELRTKKNIPTVILYSLADNFYKVII